MEGHPGVGSFARSVLFLCTVILIGIVLSLATKQVVKYARDYTTYTERAEKERFLPYPPISFCPGFKTRKKKAAIWSHSYNSLNLFPDNLANTNATTFPETVEALAQAWEETTFALDEFVKAVSLIQVGSIRHVLYPTKGGLKSAECIKVSEHSTFSGRCYTVSFPCSKDSFLSAAKVLLNLTGMTRGSLHWYIHENVQDGIFGMNNFWLLPATKEKAFVNEIREFALKKKIQREQEEVSTEAYYGCIQRLLSSLLARLAKQNGTCMAPTFESLLSFSTLHLGTFEPCTNQQAFVQSYSNIIDVLLALYWSPCKHPSLKVMYTVSNQEVLLPYEAMSGLSDVRLYYDSRDVTISEEYKLMDLGSLLSTFGGLVGMFLGWSLLDVARFLCHTLARIKIK